MTSRERWRAVLTRGKPDRLPVDYWATPEFDRKLRARLGCRTRRQALDKLGVDYEVRLRPEYAGPRLAPGRDEFGRRFRRVDYGTGKYRECVHFPLAECESVAEIERNYTWPTADWWDFSGIPAQAARAAGHPVRGGGSEPFLVYKELRGMEQAYVDLVENPEIAHYCLDKLFGLAYDCALRIYEAAPGEVDISYVAEDMGGQNDLMISVRHIREFLLPGMKRMIDLAHQAGAFAFHHNDGSCWRIVPDMIALGIDVLNPLQWRCPGMERERLKREFGPRVVLHGGMDNQRTLPFGTVEEVRREVEDNLRILGEGGGYILAPCHNIQAITPVENVLAMYEAARELGRL
ncbi:MAG TPA: uroporphyrinogen decarboxylase family protein [Candidatus Aminicenantes bacterium]|nr:uroporphyrinogen decarboxylase family protein [Candidatus Aminicenantes bacterium]